MDWVVGQEHGPVVDAVVGDQAADGHASGWVGHVRLGQGETGSQTGAEVGAVDIGGARARVVIVGSGDAEVGLEPGVAEEDVVNGSRPVEAGFIRVLFLVRLPSVVDDGCWVVLEAGR